MTATAAPAQDAGKAPAQDAGKPAEKKTISKSGWSRFEAKPGDELLLAAKLTGYAPGTQVQFKIFPTSGSPEAPLANLRGFSDERGLASAEWVYVHDPVKVKDPRLIFEAEVEGAKTLSTVLVIVDWIGLKLEDEKGKPVAGKEVRVVDPLGYLHIASSSPNGDVKLEKVACGDCIFSVRGYEIVGEMRPGDKKFRSGAKHDVSMREMTFTVEFESPKAGDVYLAGDRVPIKMAVRRVGQPWDGQPHVSANNGARIIGGAAPGQDAMKAGTQQILVLPAKDGEVELSAKFDKAVASVKVKIVRPVVSEIKFEGDGVYPLYDHRKGGRTAPYALFDAEGMPKEQHPGAYKLGSKLKVKIKVQTAEQLTQAQKIEVALVTPALVDDGLPQAGLEKGQAGKPIVLRLPKDKREAGVDFRGGETGVFLVLESDRPLPAAVRTYKWNLEVRLNQKAGGAWTNSDANLPIWPKIGDLRNLRVTSVWGEAKIGDGKDLDPGADPLKTTEYDPFHVRRAATWVDGAFNLLLDGDGSIPVRLARALRHYKWPEEYKWLRGKEGAAHARPANAAEHPAQGILDPKETPKQPTLPAAYRCAKCKAGPWSDPSAVSGACPQCNTLANRAAWGGYQYMFRWINGAYQCNYVACNIRIGPNAPATCPRCSLVPQDHGRAVRALVEVQCALCKEWLDEKAYWTGGHDCQAGDFKPEEPGKEPTGKNWGFGVLDNPTHPGGKPHQVASLLAAALNVLGVKASILYLRSRQKGAVNLTEHDPLTRGADGFDPKRDWGVSMVALVGVPVDKSRDEDLKGVKIREEETIVFDPRTLKRALNKEAATTGHELKKPDPKTMRAPNCRNGHPWKAADGGVKKKFIESFDRVRTIIDGSFVGGGGFTVARNVLASRGFTFGSGVRTLTPGCLDGVHLFVIGPIGSPLTAEERKILEEFVNEGGAVFDARNMFLPSIFGVQQTSFGGVGRATVGGGPFTGDMANQAAQCGASSALTMGNGGTSFLKENHGDIGVYFAPSGERKGRAVIVGDEEMFMNSFGGAPGAPYAQTVQSQKLIAGIFGWLAEAPGLAARKNRSCATCGAQPMWTYRCAKCNAEVNPDAKGKHSCGGRLEGVFAEALVYACPNCAKTVHDGDAECWACAAKLTARKPEDRFGQPSAGTASGGEKPAEKKTPDGKAAAPEEMPQPAGRFTITDPSGYRAVLTLQPAGQPSFINWAYHDQPNADWGWSLDVAKDVKWDAKTKTLTFVHSRENGYATSYKLTFKEDLTATGTSPQAWGPVALTVAMRKESDSAPMPGGTLRIKALWSNAVMEVGGGGDNIKVVLDFGPFHPGFKPETMQSVKWDALNHTLSFHRPEYDQRYFLTFRANGSFGGVYLSGGKFYPATGSR